MKNNTIAVIGPSGSGKTAAGRNLKPETTMWIVPENKELPFPGAAKNFVTKNTKNGDYSIKSTFVPEDDIDVIISLIELLDQKKLELAGTDKALKTEVVLIDTVTYAMLRSVRNQQSNDNWNKYIMFAEELIALTDACKNCKSDLFFVITAHVEEVENKSVSDNTIKKQLKAPAGRFLREKVDPEGLFTTVLFAECRELSEDKLTYQFRTQSGGGYPSKSPMGLFKELWIDNDYEYIIRRLKEYYNDGIIEK